MKKLLKLSLLTLLIMLCSSCVLHKDKINLEKINWKLESYSGEGKLLTNDIDIRFNSESFELEDKSNSIVEKGTYETEEAGEDGLMVTLNFENLKDPVIAGCGIKYEENKEPKYNLVFEHRNRIYSFIGE